MPTDIAALTARQALARGQNRYEFLLLASASSALWLLNLIFAVADPALARAVEVLGRQ